MTPYPSPYPQQPYGYYAADPFAALKAPAKRASILMFVLGGLLCACGMCCVAAAPLLNQAQIDAETLAQFSELETELGINLQAMLMILGGAGVLPGIVLIILGIFVRGGGGGAVITSLVIVSLMSLLLLVLLISGAADAARTGSPDTLLGLAVFVAILLLLALLLTWLVQAARNAGKITAMQAQYQMQYWQYQQQQQAYQQQQPPPPPPSSPAQ